MRYLHCTIIFLIRNSHFDLYYLYSNTTFKNCFYYRYTFESVEQLDEMTKQYINWYNYVRPHSTNNYMTPMEFRYRAWFPNKVLPKSLTSTPVRRKDIPKPNGKTRLLGIPCIWDRLIQQCIKQIMKPICEAKFSNNSYGFRPNRSVEHVINRTYTMLQMMNFHYVIEFDETEQGLPALIYGEQGVSSLPI